MVNEVTYSQLAKIAQEQGKNVAEVAKEKGISESQLADMKLQEAKLGGEMEAPGDVPQFSAYKKLDINGIKGILSVYDVNEQNGQLKLNNAALKELRQFGVHGLKLEDGVVYAQHKDGNEYPVGKGEDFNIQLATRSNIDPVSFAKSVGKAFLTTITGGVAAASPGPAAFAAAAVAEMACQNDKAEQIQIVKEKDYTTLLNSIIKEIKGLRGDIDSLRSDVNSGFNKLSDNDKLIINGLDRIFLEIQNFETKFEVSQQDMKNLLKNVEAFLKQIETNQESQIELQIAGGKSFATFVQQLFDILNNKNMDDAAKFDAILNKMQEIKDVDTSILAKLDAMFDDSKIIAAIKELSNQVAGANNTLTLIYNAIMEHGKNSDAIKALLEQVLKNQETQIKNNSAGFKAVIDAISTIPANEPVDLSTLENLMKQLVALSADNGVKLDGIAKQNDIIITILKSLGAKMDGFDAWFEKIYNKIPAGGEGGCKLDFEKLMAKLQEILEAIKDHDVHVTVDVTGKVECHCGCKDSNGVVHEGVIGNLNDLLG